MPVDEDIARQLEQADVVYISVAGEILLHDRVRPRADGEVVDRVAEQPTTRLKPQRWYTAEEDIAQQLNRSKPVHINSQGEIVPEEKTARQSDGQTIDRQTGQPTTQLKPQRWYNWYETNPGRLLQEQQAMASRFPGFQLLQMDTGLAWSGSVTPTGGGRTYTIAIVYSPDFPFEAPKVYVTNPRIRSPKHQYGDGSLCLMYPGDGTWQPNTTAVQIITMASAWLFCFEYHERHCPTSCNEVPCDYWPGAEANHGG